MALTRPSHGSPGADGSSTDLTVLLDAYADAIEAVQTLGAMLGDTITLPDTVTKFLRINIVDTPGDSNSANWPDRLAFYYKGVRAGYFGEYGEMRARPGTASTVALRAMGHTTANDVDIFEVANQDSSVLYFSVNRNAAVLTVPLTATSVTASGTVTGTNIGKKVVIGTSDPGGADGEILWIDTT